jgi:hypothetical protein
MNKLNPLWGNVSLGNSGQGHLKRSCKISHYQKRKMPAGSGHLIICVGKCRKLLHIHQLVKDYLFTGAFGSIGFVILLGRSVINAGKSLFGVLPMLKVNIPPTIISWWVM